MSTDGLTDNSKTRLLLHSESVEI